MAGRSGGEMKRHGGTAVRGAFRRWARLRAICGAPCRTSGEGVARASARCLSVGSTPVKVTRPPIPGRARSAPGGARIPNGVAGGFAIWGSQNFLGQRPAARRARGRRSAREGHAGERPPPRRPATSTRNTNEIRPRCDRHATARGPGSSLPRGGPAPRAQPRRPHLAPSAARVNQRGGVAKEGVDPSWLGPTGG